MTKFFFICLYASAWSFLLYIEEKGDSLGSGYLVEDSETKSKTFNII